MTLSRRHTAIGGHTSQKNVPTALVFHNQIQGSCYKRSLASLSITTLLSAGANSGMFSHPGSPTTKMRPQGPLKPLPAPICSGRQILFAGRSTKSGRWPSRVCMYNVKAFGSQTLEEIVPILRLISDSILSTHPPRAHTSTYMPA
jgi:hypothetical protein